MFAGDVALLAIEHRDRASGGRSTSSRRTSVRVHRTHVLWVGQVPLRRVSPRRPDLARASACRIQTVSNRTHVRTISYGRSMAWCRRRRAVGIERPCGADGSLLG